MSVATVAEVQPWELSGVLLFRSTLDDVAKEAPERFADHDECVRNLWAPIGDWLASLGSRDATALAMFRHDDGRYLLALTEMVRRDGGQPIWDYASNRAATTYRVLDLGPAATWPAEFDRDAYRTDAGKYL